MFEAERYAWWSQYAHRRRKQDSFRELIARSFRRSTDVLPPPQPRPLFDFVNTNANEGKATIYRLTKGSEWVERGEGRIFVRWYGHPVLIWHQLIYKWSKTLASWAPVGGDDIDSMYREVFCTGYLKPVKNTKCRDVRHGAYMWPTHDFPEAHLEDGLYTLINEEEGADIHFKNYPAHWERNVLVPDNWIPVNWDTTEHVGPSSIARLLQRRLDDPLFPSPGITIWRDPDDWRAERVTVSLSDIQGIGESKHNG